MSQCRGVGGGSEVDVRQWMINAQKPEKVPIRTTRRSRNTVVIYPELAMAGEWYREKDSFWTNILLGCARGIFPKTFIYREGILSCGKGKKKRDHLLPDDPQSIAEICVNVFQTICNIYSPLDIQKMKDDEDETIQHSLSQPIEWTKMKNRGTRYEMIWHYVEETYAHLATEIRCRIYTVIICSLETGRLKGKHFKLDRAKIVDIEGIEVKESGEAKCLFKAPSIRKKKENAIPKIYRHYDHWLKYKHNLFRRTTGRSTKRTLNTSMSST
jgi:hypothetical protein